MVSIVTLWKLTLLGVEGALGFWNVTFLRGIGSLRFESLCFGG